MAWWVKQVCSYHGWNCTLSSTVQGVHASKNSWNKQMVWDYSQIALFIQLLKSAENPFCVLWVFHSHINDRPSEDLNQFSNTICQSLHTALSVLVSLMGRLSTILEARSSGRSCSMTLMLQTRTFCQNWFQGRTNLCWSQDKRRHLLKTPTTNPTGTATACCQITALVARRLRERYTSPISVLTIQ